MGVPLRGTRLRREEEEERLSTRSGQSPPAALRDADEDPVRGRIIALQRASGNRAVSQLLRDAATGSAFGLGGGPASFSPLPPSLSLPADYVEKRNAEIEPKIRSFLEKEKPRIQGQIMMGASIAEIVDLVRSNVPEASQLAPAQVADLIRKHFAPLTISEHRGPGDKAGQKSELLATLRNTMKKIPTEIGFESERGWAKVTLEGVEAGLKADGGAEASLEVGWDKTIGVNTEVAAGPGKIKFGVSIEPPASAGDPVKWEMKLAFVTGGGGAPGPDKLAAVVSKGASGIRELIAEARRTGGTSPGMIKESFAPVKEALDTLAKLVGAEGATIGVSVEGEGPDVRVQATLKFSF